MEHDAILAEIPVWDPFANIVRPNDFQLEQQKLLSRLQKYRSSSQKIWHSYLLLATIPCCVGILMLMFQFFNIGFLLFSCFPLIFYYYWLNELKKDVVLFLLCEKNHWVYNPEQTIHMEDYMQRYPVLFRKGRNQSLEDEVWGTVPSGTSFWYGQFSYVVGVGKSSHTVVESTVCIPLPVSIPVSFSLVPPSFLFNFTETVETESVEFNKHFRVFADRNDSQTASDILRVLTPSVQVRLIDFSKRYDVTTLYFSAGMVGISFSDNGWTPRYTNFLREIAIDQRDEEEFYHRIQAMLELPEDMVQFIT